jgi:chaperonin GroEL
LPGGGSALLWAKHIILSDESAKYKSDTLGYAAFLRAIEAPFRQILANADLEPAKIMAGLKFSKNNMGYDVRNEKYCDMITTGIVDPHKVCRSALENAMSIAGMVLTVDSAIVEDTV